MEKNSKYILIAIIGVACFTALIIYNYAIIPELADFSDSNSDDTTSGNPDRLESVYNITLIVDYSGLKPDKTAPKFSLHDYKTTAFYATQKVCDIEYTGDPEAEAFIIEIDGVKNNVDKPNYYWIYYVNGKYAAVGTSDFNLEDGDEIKWVYEDKGG